MRVVIAPDKFKGCMGAGEVAACIARGVRRVVPDVEIDLCPLSDGGEGFVESMVGATGGEYRSSRVSGPLIDQRVDARWGFLGGGGGKVAVIEMAAASGLELVPVGERDPGRTTTFGTGELLVEAVRLGATEILLGIGGSGTMDAGLGCCQAVGHTVLRKDGEAVAVHEPLVGGDLGDIYAIKRGRGSVLDRVGVTVACDVRAVLGESARIFGRQKGATDSQAAWFEREYAGLAERCFKGSEARAPGSGAAGGLGWAMLSFFDAKLVSGVELVMEAVKLRERVTKADLCITGEGAFDEGSRLGKVTGSVGALCRSVGVRCGLVAGRVEGDAGEVFERVECLTARHSAGEALRLARGLLEEAGARLAAE